MQNYLCDTQLCIIWDHCTHLALLTGYPMVIGTSILNTMILASNLVVTRTGCCILHNTLPMLQQQIQWMHVLRTMLKIRALCHHSPHFEALYSCAYRDNNWAENVPNFVNIHSRYIEYCLVTCSHPRWSVFTCWNCYIHMRAIIIGTMLHGLVEGFLLLSAKFRRDR